MSRDRVEARFGAMGREARVVVIGGAPRADERARHLVDVVERRWSRYGSGGEVTRINDKCGHAVVVSPETYGLVTRAVGAWRVTGGCFDPSVPAPRSSSAATPMGTPSPGCARIELDERHHSVKLPAGVHLDVGGIARGFATDLAVSDLAQQGVSGVLVSIGPDVRVAGEPPRPEGWLIDVDDPFQPGSLGRLRLRAGAVSTCSARGSGTGRDAAPERVVDPSTGGAVRTGIAAVTVVAGEAWWAQALAKAALVAGVEAGIALLARQGVTGLIVRDTGDIHEAPGLEAFC